ncbi:hypothetical protein NDU88_004326 [Pleurodeles waltl]|uniref:Uncharacterized protein n=1 Tax=Pleurodeles waltl TaxID=8319 RepID=A0AAV7M6T6_PLEWA|nr:hypothetical protein NDU88_004326 [Pleurodeles waltl]
MASVLCLPRWDPVFDQMRVGPACRGDETMSPRQHVQPGWLAPRPRSLPQGATAGPGNPVSPQNRPGRHRSRDQAPPRMAA